MAGLYNSETLTRVKNLKSCSVKKWFLGYGTEILGTSGLTIASGRDYLMLDFKKNFNIFMYLFIFWPHLVACGILVPQPGIEPSPPAVEG